MIRGHVNSSINKGIFPDELKISKVIPIFKSMFTGRGLTVDHRPSRK